jgi:hypothetical protein
MHHPTQNSDVDLPLVLEADDLLTPERDPLVKHLIVGKDSIDYIAITTELIFRATLYNLLQPRGDTIPLGPKEVFPTPSVNFEEVFLMF